MPIGFGRYQLESTEHSYLRRRLSPDPIIRGEVEVEKQRITRSIDVAHRFALLLADFNLEAASADLDCLGGCTDVPPGLLDAFRQLVDNLESYRPYLPQSCLQGGLQENEATENHDVLIPVRGSTSTASRSAIGADRSPQQSSLRLGPHYPLSLFQRPISLLVSNTVDSEQLLKTSPSVYVEAVDTHLSTIVSVVTRHRGMVDYFIADKTFSVFNSVVRCPSHSQSAVRAAFELESAFPVVMNYGIAASTALCGVLGCASMKRFTTIGSAIRIAPHFERCGRALGKSIVVDSRTESDASAFCHFRLVPLRLFCRGHVLDDNLVKMLMYEAVSLIEENTTTDEWMYSLQSITNPAADYNSLALAYLQHNFDEAGFNPPPVEKDSSDPLLNTLISTIKARIPPRELTIG
ncbi:Adenylate cyclase [Diplonema papillatum]|nr:Adenylate cyclase [Diplonema papillatum]